jgi:CrcB protein
MKKYILVFILGAVGAAARFGVKSIDLSPLSVNFPLNTLLINIIGSFIFSFILTLALKTRNINPNLRLGLTAGFLSAFTTFSTLCREIIGLITAAHYIPAVLYVMLSFLLGLAAAYAAALTARAVVVREYRKLRKAVLVLRSEGTAE